MAEGARSAIQRWRVPLGFLAVVLFLVLSRPSWRLIAIGLPLAVAGLALRGWASGHLRKNAALAVSGPYAFSRNPLYLGSILMLAGGLISGGSLLLAAGLLALFMLVYYPVMRSEADHMRELFGAQYDQWAANVPLFFPRLIPSRAAEEGRFSLDLYVQHREYQAAIGVLVLYAALALKTIWAASS
ncbi:MAG: isoprenylcysteine carboxylmethyltransferase family protein [Acidobacteriota bacterium]